VSDRYFFDKMPFEQDMFSHFLTRVAQANTAAGKSFPDDRMAVRKAVDSVIASELRIVLPNMNVISLHKIALKMPVGLRHPAFGPAWLTVRAQSAYHSPALAIPGAIEHAVILAALGLPAAILSHDTMAPVGDATLDVDRLIQLAGGLENFVIGFEPAATPYHYLVSASVRSLRRCLKSDPRFRPIRHIIPTSSMPELPSPTGTWGIHPKSPTDRIPTIVHADNRGGAMTTIFIGGWMEGGVACDLGFPTLQPMPLRILEYIMRHGTLALTLMKLFD
jgi:hypothetical protein